MKWIEESDYDQASNWTSTRSVKTLSGEEIQVTSFITQIPFGAYTNSHNNLMIVNIYEKELYKLMQDHTIDASGASLILDDTGVVISHKDPTKIGKALDLGQAEVIALLSKKNDVATIQLGHKAFRMIHVQSEYNKWHYVTLISEKQIAKPIRYLRLTSILVAGISLILGIVAIFLVSSNIYRPILETMMSAKKYGKEMGAGLPEADSKNEMDFLNGILEQMMANNKKLNSQIKSNEDILKEGFVLDLLMNTPVNAIQFGKRLAEFDIVFHNPKFFMLVIQIDKFATFSRTYNEKDRALYCFGIKNISNEIINTSAFGIIVQTDQDKFAVVLNCKEDQDYAKKMANEIRENVEKIFEFTLTIGVSDCFTNFDEVSAKYHEAIAYAGAKIILGGNRTICSSDVAYDQPAHITGIHTREELIISYIKQGNVPEALNQVEKVTNIMLKQSGYPVEEIQQFFYSIIYISIKSINENGWSISDPFSHTCNLYKEFLNYDTLV
ncbi:MAG: cache domain-containing protein, partial [Vallitaleaceae bacterium]|nr:cache domain-containing protein [Vallitaleaceae bacterium]